MGREEDVRRVFEAGQFWGGSSSGSYTVFGLILISKYQKCVCFF